MSLGFTEITLILIVILLLFGAKRIPELARALGKATYEYKKAKDMIKKEADALKYENGEEADDKPLEYQLKDYVKNPEV